LEIFKRMIRSEAAMPIFTSMQLATVSKNLLKAAGASDEEAELVTGHLVKSNLVGMDSHGVQQLTSYIKGIRNGVIKPGAKLQVVQESPSTILVNGNWGFGQVICHKVIHLAIDKARTAGSAVVCVFNCNHIGRLGHYTQIVAENDMIGFICVNGDPIVAPFGGRTAVLSTNPLSYGIPSGSVNPIVLDIATSVVAEGKVRAALYKGQQIPAGWIIDSQGRPSTNPADLYEPPLPPVQTKLAGAILPTGGHKGYGLGLVVAILTGALTGTECDPDVTSGLTNAIYINVVKIDQFVPLQEFKSRVSSLVRTVKESPKAPGFTEILVPGEAEFMEEKKRSENGILIPDLTWKALVTVCKEYGLDADRLASDASV
jgi:uncharacterized oxidoreductase